LSRPPDLRGSQFIEYDMNINRKQALKKIAWGAAGTMAWSSMAAAAPASKNMTRYDGLQYQDKGEAWRNSALIVVDMQNDFVRVGAPLEVPDARKTISNTRALIDAYRKRNLPVVYTKFLSRPHYYLLWDWSPQCKPPTKCCWKGHERFYSDINARRDCTEIIDELRPEPQDTIVEKYGYGAFHETDLAEIIRSFGLNSVVITGTVTQICVEETAREAFHHGFRATVVEDAVSSFAPDLHAATLKNFAMKFGWTATSDTIVTKIA
jgi:nicotinamidase-related amidase